MQNLWFGKEHEEFVKFTPEHLKVSKLGLRLDSFVQSRKYMSLKFTEGWGGGGWVVCVMTMMVQEFDEF